MTAGDASDCGQAGVVAQRLRSAGLGGLLGQLRGRIEQLDGVRGTVTLDSTLPESALAELAKLIGWAELQRRGRSGRLRLSLPEFDIRLQESRFAVTLLDVLESDGGALTMRSHRQREAELRWAQQLVRIAAAAPAGTPATRWIAGLGGTGPSALWYRRVYSQSPSRAEEAALAVARALTHIQDTRGVSEPLALFAARLTGNPHSLDATAPAGVLLLKALAELRGSLPSGLSPSQDRAFLLSQFGLEVDAVSSTVLVANLRGSSHPVVEAMAGHGGAWPLPLSEIRGLKVAAPGSLSPGTGGPRVRPAYVLENPQVFEHLEHETRRFLPEERPTLVCTGGFLSAAAATLLDVLRATGWPMRYSGDFDRNGLAIARWLLDRYDNLETWRMTPEDYGLAVGDAGGPGLSPVDREWLKGLEGQLRDTARAMAERGLPAYQERLTEELLRDLAIGRTGP